MSKKQIALVTGVGRREGLGFEVCRQLAAKDFCVALSARTEAVSRALSDALAAEGHEVVPLPLDVTDDGARRAAVERLRSLGGLDVLVNNAAGLGRMGESVADAQLEDARDALETTLLGSWGVIQAMLPLLRASAHPRIVNVSSGAGSHGDPAFGLRSGNAMGPSYACAKAALNALTSALARELAGQRILVNAVCPGFTATFPGGAAMGARPVAEGAASIVWAAVLPDDGPSGGFFRDGKEVPW
jgi:NAD(P)-dependent dehydrogenase (short-subunit alcohol dehydrogenase family)